MCYNMFPVDVEREVVCDTDVSPAEAAHFMEAVDRQVRC
jgi:hypothetical protein